MEVHNKKLLNKGITREIKRIIKSIRIDFSYIEFCLKSRTGPSRAFWANYDEDRENFKRLLKEFTQTRSNKKDKKMKLTGILKELKVIDEHNWHDSLREFLT